MGITLFREPKRLLMLGLIPLFALASQQPKALDPALLKQCFNPVLPLNEYIPDAEPRVFGKRLYLYGSHDRANSKRFCDTILKVWSAPLSDLSKWTDHGVSFSSKADNGVRDDVPWTDNELYAPDVVEQRGKYYLYAYIVGAPCAVAVSDRPEGPFKLISKLNAPKGESNEFGGWGQYIDPGVLVEKDKVHIYWGYKSSYYAQLDPKTMVDVLPGTYKANIIPVTKPFNFFEACSPRKIGDTYYLVYADGGILVYATAKQPEGPFSYGGAIIRNGTDYPGGNIHGGLVQIGKKWFVTYHRMTNNTIFSRRTCVEPISISAGGSIPEVRMTSSGFSDSLNPRVSTPADTACILTGGAFITEFDPSTRAIVGIKSGSQVGYRDFYFGNSKRSEAKSLTLEFRPGGAGGTVEVWFEPRGKAQQLAGSSQISAGRSVLWREATVPVHGLSGLGALVFKFKGSESGEIAHLRKFSFR